MLSTGRRKAQRRFAAGLLAAPVRAIVRQLETGIIYTMKKNEVPTFDELMNPTLQALKRLGGSASIDELVPEIVRLLELPQEVAEVPHGTTGRTELEFIAQRGLARLIRKR